MGPGFHATSLRNTLLVAAQTGRPSAFDGVELPLLLAAAVVIEAASRKDRRVIEGARLDRVDRGIVVVAIVAALARQRRIAVPVGVAVDGAATGAGGRRAGARAGGRRAAAPSRRSPGRHASSREVAEPPPGPEVAGPALAPEVAEPPPEPAELPPAPGASPPAPVEPSPFAPAPEVSRAAAGARRARGRGGGVARRFRGAARASPVPVLERSVKVASGNPQLSPAGRARQKQKRR